MSGKSGGGPPEGAADPGRPRDRRTTHRAAIEIPAVLRVGDRRVTCTVRDLSTTGISLTTGERLAPGIVVRVAFRLPNARVPVEVSGSLVRQSGSRAESTVGLRLVEPDAETMRTIKTFVSRNRSDRPFSRRPGGSGRPDPGELEISDGEAELRGLYRRAVDGVGKKPQGRRGLLDRLLRRGR